MSKHVSPIVQLLFDHREKLPWDTSFFVDIDKSIVCTRTHLKVGDYTIKGFESYLAIERKNSIDELVAIYSNAKLKKNWLYELSMLKQYRYKYIIIEDHLDRIPSVVPRNRNFNILSLYKAILEFQSVYGIPTIFIGQRTKKTSLLMSLFFRNLLTTLMSGTAY